MNEGSDGLEPVLFRGRVFDVIERQQLGRSGKMLKRQIVKHSGSVAVIPVLPDGRILLLRQLRPAVQKFIFEIPAGILEQNEIPSEAAKRELLEETGWFTNRLVRLKTIYSSPGFVQEEITIFLATDLEMKTSSLEDGEILTLKPLSWSEIDQMIDNEEIVDAKTLIGLLLAKRVLNLN